MNTDKKKIYLSISIGFIFSIAVIWLVIRGCSAIPRESVNVYHIGRDSIWYPLDLRGKEKAMVGFSNDLMASIAAEQGFKAYVFEVGPNALFDGLDIRNYDAVLSSLPPNVVNRKRYEFSDPFYLMGPVLVVREDSDIRSLEDMNGKIMGIESGALQVFNIAEPPNVVIIPYPTAAGALENLYEDVIDGVLLDVLKAYVWTEGFYAGRLKVTSSPLTNKGLRLITLKTPRQLKLVSQFNAGLKVAKENGLYDKLLEKWNLTDTEIDTQEANL